jgi:hypothetical protein
MGELPRKKVRVVVIDDPLSRAPNDNRTGYRGVKQEGRRFRGVFCSRSVQFGPLRDDARTAALDRDVLAFRFFRSEVNCLNFAVDEVLEHFSEPVIAAWIADGRNRCKKSRPKGPECPGRGAGRPVRWEGARMPTVTT